MQLWLFLFRKKQNKNASTMFSSGRFGSCFQNGVFRRVLFWKYIQVLDVDSSSVSLAGRGSTMSHETLGQNRKVWQRWMSERSVGVFLSWIWPLLVSFECIVLLTNWTKPNSDISLNELMKQLWDFPFMLSCDALLELMDCRGLCSCCSPGSDNLRQTNWEIPITSLTKQSKAIQDCSIFRFSILRNLSPRDFYPLNKVQFSNPERYFSNSSHVDP